MRRWILVTPIAVLLALALPLAGMAQEDDAGKPTETEDGEETPAEPTEGQPAEGEEAPGKPTDGEPAPPPEPESAKFSPPLGPGEMTWEQAWDAGFALYREGRHAEAIPYLERALSLEENDPTVRAYLAECYRQTGDEARAAEVAPTKPTQATSDGDDDEEDDDDGDDEDGEGEDEDEDEDEDDDDHFHMMRSTRQGRHLGFGVAVLNNTMSLGMYVEVLPIHFLAVQGGIGLGDVHTRFWWAQVAALPINGPFSPAIGIGVSGNFGLDYRHRDWLLPGVADYYLARINPYAHVGLVLVTRVGFTAAFEINAVITGDPTFPVAPRAGFRLGLLL